MASQHGAARFIGSSTSFVKVNILLRHLQEQIKNRHIPLLTKTPYVTKTISKVGYRTGTGRQLSIFKRSMIKMVTMIRPTVVNLNRLLQTVLGYEQQQIEGRTYGRPNTSQLFFKTMVLSFRNTS